MHCLEIGISGYFGWKCTRWTGRPWLGRAKAWPLIIVCTVQNMATCMFVLYCIGPWSREMGVKVAEAEQEEKIMGSRSDIRQMNALRYKLDTLSLSFDLFLLALL